MSKVLKRGLLVILAILVLWGGWSLLHREEDDGVFLVVLDPGHGGDDPGAVVGETLEKDINLAIALLVREQLEEQEGITVLMTREQDVYPSLTDRADFANRENADLFVSIHANSLEDDSYAGIITFYHPDKRSSRAFAQAIQAAAAAASGGIDRGVRSEDYAVLRETDMPAVLVETGFMTCPEELALLQDADYQKLLAEGIAQGILNCRD
ncbi:MAG: N-acetylmuramoyl-L-alanine amidase [Oscillospiraceae bacterium]